LRKGGTHLKVVSKGIRRHYRPSLCRGREGLLGKKPLPEERRGRRNVLSGKEK